MKSIIWKKKEKNEGLIVRRRGKGIKKKNKKKTRKRRVQMAKGF